MIYGIIRREEKVMNQLENARKEIEKIDQEMAQLYERRLDAVMEVVAYKKKFQLPVLDCKREQELIKKNRAYIQNPRYEKSYCAFFQMVMDNSKAFQKEVLENQE